MYKKLIALCSLCFLLSTVYLLPGKIGALTCAGPSADTQQLGYVADDADYIFVGDVLDATSNDPAEKRFVTDVVTYIYTVKVRNSYKGNATGTIKVSNGGPCGITLSTKEAYLIYGSKENGQILISTASKRLANAGDDIKFLNGDGFKATTGPYLSKLLLVTIIPAGLLSYYFIKKAKKPKSK